MAEMIGETATSETRASGLGRWARWAGRLGGALAFLVVGGLVGLLLLTAVMPRLSGYQTYVIYGSSMGPAVKLGSLIVAKTAKVEDLRVGDIIVFSSPGNDTTVTHRIVGIREAEDGLYFQTKGDASNGSDPREVELQGRPVHKFVYAVPYLGYFVNFAKTALGIALLVALPAAALVALELPQARKKTSEARIVREDESLGKG